jgi:outer membrane protein assembly factor BamA
MMNLSSFRLLRIIIVFILFSSCTASKYVPEGKYLLDKYEIRTENKQINKEEMNNYIRQKPNKRILGFKFHLYVYNLSNPQKDNWINRWLRKIGEEPVIFEAAAQSRTRSQLELYLRNKGYYNSIVMDTALIKGQKAHSIFAITLNQPYTIGNVSYRFEDESLREEIFKDTANSLLKRGSLMDIDVISSERERIAENLRNKGYYNFDFNYVYFEADSTVNSGEVSLVLIIKKYREYISLNNYRDIPHPQYKIGKVIVNTSYSTRDVLAGNEAYFEGLDTIIAEGIHIVYFQKPIIKSSSIVAATLINPGDLYTLINVTGSYRHLSSLQMFRLITIDFKYNGETSLDSFRLLDCTIDLTPQILKAWDGAIEGTNSSGNIGVAGNLTFQNRNLFRGAENFNLRLKGAVETLRETRDYNFGNMIEFGIESRLRIPKFLLPFKTDQFIRKFSPSSSLNLAYNYQRRPDYIRTLANASLSYNWRGNRYLTHFVSPVEINLVKIPYKSQAFTEWLEGKYIFYSYQPNLISLSSYTLIYSNQNIQKSRSFSYVKLNAESAGNLLASSYKIADIEKVDGNYMFLRSEFSQYLKGDIDFRYYKVLDPINTIVYRVFSGGGYPYGNSTALPFEKKYFSGGANSIRAWQVRNLGPGSFSENETSYYPNQTADIKLEANIEYRFKLFWLLEGALFVDAGNIWSITSNDERVGALFELDKFYKDIAIGTGFGTRFDFTYFIFRLDLGVKVRDPAVVNDNKWIPGVRKYGRNDFTLNLGIGYPF